jgi:hypothetical protein
MVMEYVSGGELFDYIVKHGKVRVSVGRPPRGGGGGLVNQIVETLVLSEIFVQY